jgi:predicted metal-dependent hydrolase
MIPNPVIIREYRKSISLKVNQDSGLIIKAPYGVSDKIIMEFVLQKKRWIQNRINSIDKQNQIIKTLDIENSKITIIKNKAQEILNEELEIWSSITGLRFTTCKVTSAKSIWGSCNAKNEIRLNWRLLLVPKECREYVMVHELAHIIHKNHSKNFWNKVEEFYPEYKKYRLILKNYGQLFTKY